MSKSKSRATQQHASSARKYGTIELFEQYWVVGKPMDQIGCSTSLFEQRGVPTRNQEDALALQRGDVAVHELWDDYLTTFQLRVVQELARMRKKDMGDLTERDQ